MGNDGGSIARRDELVKVKAGPSKVDPAAARRARWTLCHLSRQPLHEPIVADALGRLYNKEAVVSWLIDRKVNGIKPAQDKGGLPHVKGLKDMTELKLSANASKTTHASSDADGDEASSRFHCPLTGKPMNGAHRFVFIRTSGAVMSESGLKAIISESDNSSKRRDAPLSTAAAASFECPITSAPFQAGSLLGKNGAAAQDPDNVGDVILLNPSEKEEEILRAAMTKHREASGAPKSKSSAADTPRQGESKRSREGGEAREPGKDGKKQKHTSPPSARDGGGSTAAPHGRADSPPSAATASANRIAALAAKQAKSKPMSKALASIYGLQADGDKKVEEKESWLVRGTGLGR